MLANLRHLLRYRGLIESLVARELKARYRGSVLGFLWSFINPLLLLLIYFFVFTVLRGDRGPEDSPFALLMFCGLLPWIWFSSSLLESSNVLIAGGNLIRKVLFPSEVLPLVSVLAGMIHFGLGLVVLAGFLAYNRVAIAPLDLLWLPLIVAIQLLLTAGLALLVSAMTVHFRDVRDLLANLLTLWFFATPIVYPASLVPASARPFINLNPFTHLVSSYQEVLVVPGPFRSWPQLLLVGLVAAALFAFGYFVFDRLRDTLAEEV